MNPNSPSEKNFSQDPFKNPDNQIPGKFQTSKWPNKNPYSVNLVRDLIVGPNSKSNKETKSNPNKEKENVFGKKGISRPKFREVLRKKYVPNIPLNRLGREKIEQEIKWRKAGNTIDEKDIVSFEKDLKEEERAKPHTEEEIQDHAKKVAHIKAEEKLLEILRKDKK